MDDLFGVHRKKEIIFRNFFEKYKQKFGEDPKHQNDIDICKTLNIETVNLDMLKINCSIDNLMNADHSVRKMEHCLPDDDEHCGTRNDDLDDLNIELKSFKAIRKWKETYKSNPLTRSNQSYKKVALPEKNTDEYQSEDHDQLIVTVRLYRPTRAIHNGQTLEKPVFTQEFRCLGSNYLTELRDKISCICNGKKFFDISDGPVADSVIKKEDTNPAYFFIHDTFYNDMRNPDNPDYSATIRKWAAEKSNFNNTIHYKVADMAKTRFIDLTASLGFPQQYMHHGNCEHIFVISQLEYLPASHVSSQTPSKAMFPYLCSYNIYSNSTCFMCGVRKYCFIVEKSKRQLYDPSYLCKVCYESFHFVNGKKVGEFKAYQIYKDNDNNEQSEDGQIEINEEGTNSSSDDTD